MSLFLLGAITMASFVAGLFFLRFWRETKDRLFLAFGTSFLVEGVNRTALALSDAPNEGAPFFYLVRLLAYALILGAVVDKNRSIQKTLPPAATPAVRDPLPQSGVKTVGS
jgi:uncharacterized membrane protein HdeD (DUF308 family)